MDVLVDIRAIRRENLEGLIASMAAGNMAAFADRIGASPAHLSQIRNGTREIGHRFARKIEMALGKGKGWMDLPQFRAPEATQKQLEIAQIIENLAEEDQDLLLSMARQINDQRGKKSAAAPFAGVPKRAEVPAAQEDPRTSAGAAAAQAEPKKRRRR